MIWLIVFGLDFFSNLQYDPPTKALAFAILAILFYGSIIYGNGSWLIPQFYHPKRRFTYLVLALILLVSAILLRCLGALCILHLFAATDTAKITRGLLLYSAFSGIWIFLFSVLYRLAMDYFALSRRQNEMVAEKARTELHLLKQQVHPHFLFNTLNNIYYAARKGAPEAADLILRLSAIMRYFIDEGKKDEVPLQEEIDLLKSYIELESIRMRYEMPICFRTDAGDASVLVPPLLFLPLVENIFKHGIDKRCKDNFAEISLTLDQGRLAFTTRNRYYAPIGAVARGTGLTNLRQRLQLYYDDRWTLQAAPDGIVFISSLQIPVYVH